MYNDGGDAEVGADNADCQIDIVTEELDDNDIIALLNQSNQAFEDKLDESFGAIKNLYSNNNVKCTV